MMPADTTLPSKEELNWLENYARLERSRGVATIAVPIEQALAFTDAARAVRRVEALSDAMADEAWNETKRETIARIKAALTGSKP